MIANQKERGVLREGAESVGLLACRPSRDYRGTLKLNLLLTIHAHRPHRSRRIGWENGPGWEFAVAGQNPINERQGEWDPQNIELVGL